MRSFDRRDLLLGASAGLLFAKSAQAGARGDLDTWLNPPRKWSRGETSLMVQADPKTDFWRKTYFGYVTDNGHFLSRPVTGDFQATVNVEGDYAAQYDQAGLMVRLDPACWMKCGVEFVDGAQTVSSVFTRDYSDWAGIPREAGGGSLWFRVVRKGEALTFSFSPDGKVYREVRQGHLTAAPTLRVGIMVAAPEGPGFAARFRDLTITPV
jgi:uncharacterized protein